MSIWNESARPRYLFVATNLVQNKWGLGNLHDHKLNKGTHGKFEPKTLAIKKKDSY